MSNPDEEYAAYVDGLLRHCREKHVQTSNAYFAIVALAIAHREKWETPEWALDIILIAIERAYLFRSGNPSLDRELGLINQRGKTPAWKAARKAEVETEVFEKIKVINACFRVPIEKACEVVFGAIDYDLAREFDEDVYTFGLATDERNTAAIEKWIDMGSYPEAVNKKLRALQHWTITNGDRLGYGIERLIDKYYRVGTKQKNPYDGNEYDQEYLFLLGRIFHLWAPKCANRVLVPNDRGIVQAVSALSKLEFRDSFAECMKKEDERVAAEWTT